jgi:hypothetical protein
MADHDVTGRIRWRIFALVALVGAAGAGGVGTGIATGVVPASFAISGTSYQITADDLDGQGLVQYGAVARAAGEAHPAVVTAFRRVRVDNFCQSVVLPDLPGIGAATIRMTAPGTGGLTADNLVLAIDTMSGDLTLDGVEIGHDAGAFDTGPPGATGAAGSFGIQATGAHLAHLRQVTWSVTASTLRLNQVRISVSRGRAGCF